MQGSARVLIIGQSAHHDASLSDALTSQGFEVSGGSIKGSAAEITGTRRPDIVILDFKSDEARTDPTAFLALAKTLKNSALGCRMRVVVLGSVEDAKFDQALSSVDDLLLGQVNTAQICHRLKALVRLNTMHEELVRRLNTSARYGVDAPIIAPPSHVDNPTVLVLGQAIDFGPIENALARQATLVGALTVPTAMDYLTRQPFDAVIINFSSDLGARFEAPAPDLEYYLGFARDLRRNSRLFNVPVVLLGDDACFAASDSIYDAGITDLIVKPFSGEELKLRINALVRELRFRDRLKHVYGQAKHFATSDALTGLYSRGFLLEHMATVIEDAERTSQSFAVAGLTVSNIADLNDSLGFAGGDRVIRQVGEVISFLIRGEDLGARYSGSRFALLLPDTPAEAATHAVNRIRGVVAHTEFAIDGVDTPVYISLSTRITGHRAGDAPETMMARVWSADPVASAVAA